MFLGASGRDLRQWNAWNLNLLAVSGHSLEEIFRSPAILAIWNLLTCLPYQS